MSELKERLDRDFEDLPISPDGLEKTLRLAERRSRNRRIGTIVVALAIAVSGGILVTRAFGASESVPVDTPLPTPQIASPQPPPGGPLEPYILDLGTGETRWVVPDGPATHGGSWFDVSPQGEEIAYLSSSAQKVSIVSVDGSNDRSVGTWVPPQPGKVGTDPRDPRWSPDGTRLVYEEKYSCCDGDLFMIDVASGETTQITHVGVPGRITPPKSPTFTPDGDSVLFDFLREEPKGSLEEHWDLYSVPADGGEATLVREDTATAEFSPDGQQVAFLTRLQRLGPYPFFTASRVSVADAGSLDSERTLVEGEHIVSLRWSPDGTRIAYTEAGDIYIVDVATGASTKVLDHDLPEDPGNPQESGYRYVKAAEYYRSVLLAPEAEWLDDHSLIISTYLNESD
jgi:dipeptidyl aminopeptidase/acylaminoacyl peptidase